MNKSFFEKYTSNTCAASANQLYFSTNGEVRVSRAFFKIFAQGEFNYSLLFSNTIDSTYADGKISQKNLVCGEWTLHSAKIGRCAKMGTGAEISTLTELEAYDFVPLTFDKKTEKVVSPAEIFASDEVKIRFEKGEYMCLELEYSGDMIPYHEESFLPIYTKTESGWKYDRRMPLPSMIGCDRSAQKRIAYAGDSITQGIGVAANSYEFWNSRVSESLGEKYAYWNLGIGFGRANDAASDGVWLYQVKQNDIAVVCYGVNDICQGMSEEQIKSDLLTIVEKLNEAGCGVILQTVPPFNYNEERMARWLRINDYIKTELSKKVLFVFDVVPYLSLSEQEPQQAKFGGHPNEEGSKVWADALYKAMLENGF